MLTDKLSLHTKNWENQTQDMCNMIEDLAKLVKVAENQVNKHSVDLSDIFKTLTHI